MFVGFDVSGHKDGPYEYVAFINIPFEAIPEFLDSKDIQWKNILSTIFKKSGYQVSKTTSEIGENEHENDFVIVTQKECLEKHRLVKKSIHLTITVYDDKGNATFEAKTERSVLRRDAKVDHYRMYVFPFDNLSVNEKNGYLDQLIIPFDKRRFRNMYRGKDSLGRLITELKKRI